MKVLFRLVPTLLALSAAMLLVSLMVLALGESPRVLAESLYQTLFTGFGIGHSLYYATPLIFTGLSVSLAFHCGLFNIGGEGQLYWGAISIVMVSQLFPNLPPLLAITMGVAASGIAGALWGGLAGYLKAKRGSHEVITTILLNFIAYSWVSYLTLYPFKDRTSQNPESVLVPDAYTIAPLSSFIESFSTTPVNFSLVFAVLLAALTHYFLYFTSTGFEWRAVGKSATVSRYSGIPIAKATIGVFALSGMLSGFVGINEVMGNAHRVVEGFSIGYGFTGIAVALLANARPLLVLPSAFLFGVLSNFSREIEFSSEVLSKEISLVIQAILIAFVACPALKNLLQRRHHVGSP